MDSIRECYLQFVERIGLIALISPIFVRNAPSNVVVAMKPESESTYDKSTTTNVFKETM